MGRLSSLSLEMVLQIQELNMLGLRLESLKFRFRFRLMVKRIPTFAKVLTFRSKTWFTLANVKFQSLWIRKTIIVLAKSSWSTHQNWLLKLSSRLVAQPWEIVVWKSTCLLIKRSEIMLKVFQLVSRATLKILKKANTVTGFVLKDSIKTRP